MEITMGGIISIGLFVLVHTGALIWQLSKIQSALVNLVSTVTNLEQKVYTDHANKFSKMEHRVTVLESK